MVNAQDILRAIVVPAIVSTIVALLGRWRRWTWPMPVAIGAGFLTGAFLISGNPGLPPADGTDWLLWAAIPAIILGLIDAFVSSRWGFLLSAIAGLVAYLIARPLSPATVSISQLWTLSISVAAMGVALCAALRFAETKLGAGPVLVALSILFAATGIVVLSSNLRIVGIYGLAAAASLVPLSLIVRTGTQPTRPIAIVGIALLSGLLVGGHLYPDPGISRLNAALLLTAPFLIAIAASIPVSSRLLRASIGTVLITALVAWIAIPIALAAKKAAEGDPYGANTR